VDPVDVPTGVTQFPAEPQRVPRPWVEERFTDLRYWSEPKVGGHFASLEQPETFVDEVRAFFRLVRPATARLDDPRRRRDSGGRASPDGRR
jgi:hypothetical protein